MVSCQCEYLFQESSHCKSTIKVMIVKRKGRQLYEIPFFLYEWSETGGFLLPSKLFADRANAAPIITISSVRINITRVENEFTCPGCFGSAPGRRPIVAAAAYEDTRGTVTVARCGQEDACAVGERHQHANGCVGGAWRLVQSVCWVLVKERNQMPWHLAEIGRGLSNNTIEGK